MEIILKIVLASLGIALILFVIWMSLDRLGFAKMKKKIESLIDSIFNTFP